MLEAEEQAEQAAAAAAAAALAAEAAGTLASPLPGAAPSAGPVRKSRRWKVGSIKADPLAGSQPVSDLPLHQARDEALSDDSWLSTDSLDSFQSRGAAALYRTPATASGSSLAGLCAEAPA